MASFLDNIPKITRSILIICVIVFLGSLIGDLSGRGDILSDYLALFFPASENFRWWQPVTYMFVHGNFTHIFFNMWAFVLFGSVLEQELGPKRYLTLFLVCGIGAAAIHLGVEYLQYKQSFAELSARFSGNTPEEINDVILKWNMVDFDGFGLKDNPYYIPPTVGASGAIYGIMLAFAMTWPDARLMLLIPPVSLKAKWMALIFVAIELITGIFFTSDGVAHFAHLGGMLFAFILMIWWRRRGVLRRYYY